MNAQGAATDFLALRAWLSDALDLWSGAGFNHSKGHFYEALAFDGRAAGTERRLFVQARQIATFARASLEGSCSAADLAMSAFETMVRDYCITTTSSRIWARAVDGREGRSGEADLYSYAFVLFSLGWLFRLTGDAKLVRIAEETLCAIEARFPLEMDRRANSRNPATSLEQNPQMHLLEAMLVLAEATGKDSFAEHANAIVGLLEERLICPDTGLVPEHFGPGWSHQLPTDAKSFEPGHQFEWAWLLHEHERITGGRNAHLIPRLIAPAAANGRNAATGLVVEEISSKGEILCPNSRLWAQAEALRTLALVSVPQTSMPGQLLAGILGAAVKYHLKPAIAGGYVDRVDGEGRPVSQWMPASALYHIAGTCLSLGPMFLEKACKGIDAASPA